MVLRVFIVKQQLVKSRLSSLFILEINFLGLPNCQNVVCANGGVCNPVPTTENGVEMQCLCLNGNNQLILGKI
jgi:hypothetical protein